MFPLLVCFAGVGGGRYNTRHCLFDHTLFYSQLTSHCPQPLQVLRQRQLSAPGPGAPGGLGLGGPGPGLYGSGSGAPISSGSGSWPGLPTNPIHIKQEIQIPQVRRVWIITKILELKRLIFFRFPHWQVHQTAAPVQAWCQEMSAYSQVTHSLITYSLTDLS